MYLQSPVTLRHISCNYAENSQNQYNDVPRMQHGEHTQIVLTSYTALCSLYKTVYAVLMENSMMVTHMFVHTFYLAV